MLLLGNGTVMTRWEEQPMLRDGCVAMEDGVICALGTTEELKAKYPQAEFVDARGGVIMPGLINVHTHIYSGLGPRPVHPGLQPDQLLRGAGRHVVEH